MTSNGLVPGFTRSTTAVPKRAFIIARRLRLASGDWGESSTKDMSSELLFGHRHY
jgi:hypothetical protein